MKPCTVERMAWTNVQQLRANNTISLPNLTRTSSSLSTMLSTKSHRQSESYSFVSNLAALLAARGKTQRQLARASGIPEETVSRLVNQTVVHSIVTRTTIEICLVLSQWPINAMGRKMAVRLDALYSLKRQPRTLK